MSWSLQASGSAVPNEASSHLPLEDLTDEQAAGMQLANESNLADALEAVLSSPQYGTVSAEFHGQYVSRQYPPPAPEPEPEPEPELSVKEQIDAAVKAAVAAEFHGQYIDAAVKAAQSGGTS